VAALIRSRLINSKQKTTKETKALSSAAPKTFVLFVAFCKKIQTFRVSDHKILRSTSVKGQKSHHSDNKQMKGTMQDKTKKKKEKKEIKLPDLKPAKDAKGGAAPPDPARRPPG
jgi:hypothetical protein